MKVRGKEIEKIVWELGDPDGRIWGAELIFTDGSSEILDADHPLVAIMRCLWDYFADTAERLEQRIKQEYEIEFDAEI